MSAAKIALSTVALLAIVLTVGRSAVAGNIAAWFQIILPLGVVGGMLRRARSAERDEARQLARELQS